MTETAEEFLDGVRNCMDFLFILGLNLQREIQRSL